MAFFNWIETLFFVSLGITFILIVLLVNHFKGRLVTLEFKYTTVFDILNKVVSELKLIKSAQVVAQQSRTNPVQANITMVPMGPGVVAAHARQQIEHESSSDYSDNYDEEYVEYDREDEDEIRKIVVSDTEAEDLPEVEIDEDLDDALETKDAAIEPESKADPIVVTDFNDLEPIDVDTNAHDDTDMLNSMIEHIVRGAMQQEDQEPVDDDSVGEPVEISLGEPVDLEFDDIDAEPVDVDVDVEPVEDPIEDAVDESIVEEAESQEESETPVKMEYKKLDVAVLRAMAMARGIETTKKMKKQDLIRLLEAE
jgi:hypothetical protein